MGELEETLIKDETTKKQAKKQKKNKRKLEESDVILEKPKKSKKSKKQAEPQEPQEPTLKKSKKKPNPETIENPPQQFNSKWTYSQSPQLSALPQSTIQSFLKSNSINTTNTKLNPILEFSQIQFPEKIQATISKLGYVKPTPIQSASWPNLLCGDDLIGIASTGSGKTCAFGIPALIHVLNNKKNFGVTNSVKKATPAVLIVSPTRELAIQIQQTLGVFAEALGLNSQVVFGGVNKGEQKRGILSNGGADIIVATPGRLIDLVGGFGTDNNYQEAGCIDLTSVGIFILDEADRMLDMGFEKDIKRIANACTSPTKQTVMFSATWPPQIQSLALTYLKSPIHITIGESNTLSAASTITQLVTVVDPYAKESKLLELLKKYHDKKNRVLVFVLYKKEAVRVEGFLKRNGWGNVKSIQGDLPQSARMEALESFKNGTCPLLIATDVAARGLDIPNVEYVINYTYPLTTEEYCHRIGRTGRAGKTGISHTLFTVHDKSHSGALINVLKGAKQQVPDALFQFGTTVKKKLDPNYGAFAKDVDFSKKGTKIVFD